MVLSKTYFSQYGLLEAGIKSIKRRIRYYENHPLSSEHGVVKGSMKRFPFAVCHYVVSGPNVKSAEKREQEIMQLRIDLKGNLQLLEDMKLDIERFIENSDLLSMEERVIMRFKFIERKKDREIGEELGYERSVITKKIGNIMDKLPIKEINKSI